MTCTRTDLDFMLSSTMNSLKKGVRLFCPHQGELDTSRLLLSTGTTQEFEPESVSKVSYRSAAFLPTQNWRAPSWEERSGTND